MYFTFSAAKAPREAAISNSASNSGRIRRFIMSFNLTVIRICVRYILSV